VYIRIIRGQAQPGQVEELARRWRDFFLPRREQAGVRHAYFAGDRATNTTVAVSIWDERPDAAMTAGWSDFLSEAADLSAGETTVEEYEVLADL